MLDGFPSYSRMKGTVVDSFGVYAEQMTFEMARKFGISRTEKLKVTKLRCNILSGPAYARRRLPSQAPRRLEIPASCASLHNKVLGPMRWFFRNFQQVADYEWNLIVSYVTKEG